jgi:hypothetical protein
MVGMLRVAPRVALETANQLADGGINFRIVRIARPAPDTLMALAGLALRAIARLVTH